MTEEAMPQGLTERQYYAGQALAALIAKHGEPERWMGMIIEDAHAFADKLAWRMRQPAGEPAEEVAYRRRQQDEIERLTVKVERLQSALKAETGAHVEERSTLRREILRMREVMTSDEAVDAALDALYPASDYKGGWRHLFAGFRSDAVRKGLTGRLQLRMRNAIMAAISHAEVDSEHKR